jgi:hypothetical protein
VTRASYLSAAVLSSLLLAAPAGAQTSEMPTELWSQYPLVQKVERPQPKPKPTQSSAIGPLLPPSGPEATPSAGESTRWSVWLAALALGSIVLLVAARTVPPLATSGIRVVGGHARRLRPPALPRPRPRSRARTPKTKPMHLRERPAPPETASGRRQYAPALALPEHDVERDSRRYIVRRSGFLRSCFVVVEDEPGGHVKRVASSRSFWRVGGAPQREHAADDVWSDFVNDLRVAGWEPSAPQSSFWVPLRRLENGPSAILPTIEAHTLSDDPG